jgi:hypothetical protein
MNADEASALPTVLGSRLTDTRLCLRSAAAGHSTSSACAFCPVGSYTTSSGL